MPRKRKRSVGRPPNKNQAVVIRLVLSLDPIEHAELIEKLLDAPPRGRASVALDLMINKVLAHEQSTIADSVDNVVSVDCSVDDM